MTDQDWHGWSVGDASLYVGPLPGRKQICLYELDKTDGGSAIRVLAFFKSEGKARTTLKALDQMNTARMVLATLE